MALTKSKKSGSASSSRGLPGGGAGGATGGGGTTKMLQGCPPLAGAVQGQVILKSTGVGVCTLYL